MAEFKVFFGDDGVQARAESTDVNLSATACDELEIDCWNLIKTYAKAMNIDLLNENDEPVTEDDIDFYRAKAVQDLILNMFTEVGFRINFNSKKE